MVQIITGDLKQKDLDTEITTTTYPEDITEAVTIDMSSTPPEIEDGKTSLGSMNLYEMNKSLMKNEKGLSNYALTEECRKISKFFIQNQNINNKYFMLLCRDRNDYTIFHFLSNKNTKSIQDMVATFKLCLTNRGKTLSIDKDVNGNAMEIWIRIFDEEDNEEKDYAYYLFPYDTGVVEY